MALEGTLSSSAAVLPGVARGTVLGPLLFLTYIGDLPDTVQHSSARLFADDSLLYRRIKDQHDQAILQEDHDSLGGITHLANGIQPKQMQQHPHHAQQAQISSDIGYHLHGQTLETSVSKYPGITISSDLSWSTHVENVAARGNQKMGVRAKVLQGVYPKSQVGDLHHNGTAHTGVCLVCLMSPHAQGHPHTGKSTTTNRQVRDQQLHGQVTRHCYIHARKSKMVKS